MATWNRLQPDVPTSPWHTLTARETYRNPWLAVTEYAVTRPDGSAGIYGIVEPGDNVTILAIDDQQQVLLVHDFIYPVQEWAWSLPSGAVEIGEDIAAAAARELAEEGGLLAQQWQLLGSFWLTPGISPQTSHCFVARGLQQIGTRLEPTEVITHRWVSLAEATQACVTGDIRHATAIIPLLLAQHLLK